MTDDEVEDLSRGAAIEVRLLLDTAVLIYRRQSPERLSKRARPGLRIPAMSAT